MHECDATHIGISWSFRREAVKIIAEIKREITHDMHMTPCDWFDLIRFDSIPFSSWVLFFSKNDFTSFRCSCVVLCIVYRFCVVCIGLRWKNQNKHAPLPGVPICDRVSPSRIALLRFCWDGACWTKCFGISITLPRWDFRGPCKWWIWFLLRYARFISYRYHIDAIMRPIWVCTNLLPPWFCT